MQRGMQRYGATAGATAGARHDRDPDRPRLPLVSDPSRGPARLERVVYVRAGSTRDGARGRGRTRGAEHVSGALAGPHQADSWPSQADSGGGKATKAGMLTESVEYPRPPLARDPPRRSATGVARSENVGTGSVRWAGGRCTGSRAFVRPPDYLGGDPSQREISAGASAHRNFPLRVAPIGNRPRSSRCLTNLRSGNHREPPAPIRPPGAAPVSGPVQPAKAAKGPVRIEGNWSVGSVLDGPVETGKPSTGAAAGKPIVPARRRRRRAPR
jgi:hypothetical protein